MNKFIVVGITSVAVSLVSCASAQTSSAAPTQTTSIVSSQLTAKPATSTITATAVACTKTTKVLVIPLTKAKHSGVINHANAAIRLRHYPRIMVLNRVGAAARRTALLKHIPTKPGFDRDEYPPASARKVVKADVAYVNSSQNRSAGAVMGNFLRKYCNGVRFVYAGT
jgi:hypothetical protein